MATFLFDGDKLVECPYNPIHRVLSKRLLGHLNKCAAEHGSPQLKTCQFNVHHRIPLEEYATHIVECPDNRQAVRELKKPATNNEAPQNSDPIQQSEDDWESTGGGQYVLHGLNQRLEEADGSSFLPQHQLYGLKPAERKRVYNTLAEGVIRRKAAEEREELTEEEAVELGLPYTRPEFEIDTHGHPEQVNDEAQEAVGERASVSVKTEATEETGRNVTTNRAATRPVSVKQEPVNNKSKNKRSYNEDEDDKEEVQRMIRDKRMNLDPRR